MQPRPNLNNMIGFTICWNYVQNLLTQFEEILVLVQCNTQKSYKMYKKWTIQ